MISLSIQRKWEEKILELHIMAEDVEETFSDTDEDMSNAQIIMMFYGNKKHKSTLIIYSLIKNV